MPLSADQIQVTSFETAAAEAGGVPQPLTTPRPGCYSPKCVPTALPEQCPDTQAPAC